MDKHRRVVFALLAVIVCLSFSSMPASAKDSGRIEVRTAYAELEEGVFFINANLDYLLSEKALEALASGVTLNIELQIDVNQVRRYIWDSNIASLRQRYQLSFHALTERYLVANLNSGERESFADLGSALTHLGRVVHLPIIDEALLDADARYQAALRAVMDVKELPGPLKLLSLVWGDWRVVSETYTWPLRQ